MNKISFAAGTVPSGPASKRWPDCERRCGSYASVRVSRLVVQTGCPSEWAWYVEPKVVVAR